MKYRKTDREQLIVLLRFGSRQPPLITHRWQSYRQIATMLNVSYSLVRSTIMEYLASRATKEDSYKVLTRSKMEDHSGERWTRSQLKQQHLDFLTSKEVLRLWSGMTMRER